MNISPKMTKLPLAILLLLPSLVLVGCDFEQVVHSQIDRNSKTVTLWHEAKSTMTCRINLDSKMVGPIDLPEGEKWVFQYEGEPDSIHGWCG
jgi:hypothetical protein